MEHLHIAITWNADESDATIYIPLRPLFAALAMNGLLANSAVLLPEPADETIRDAIAKASWRWADAMLKQGDEKPQAGEVAE